MATKPLNAYTVQEATNLKVYEDYKSETVTVADTTIGNAIGTPGTNTTSDWSANPAKEVMIVLFSTDASTQTLKLKLYINGTAGDQIDILLSSLPLTISGLLIDQIIFATSDTGTDEVVEVISFH